MNKLKINVIGCGKAASTLIKLLDSADLIDVGGVLNRSPESTQTAIQRLGAGTALPSMQVMPKADCLLVGAGDPDIAGIVSELSALDISQTMVFHLSGRLGLEVLASLKHQSAATATVHMVRAFADYSLQPSEFQDTPCVAQGDHSALAILKPLFTAIGGSWIAVDQLEGNLYHAATAVLSNGSKALLWQAISMLRRAGLDQDSATLIGLKVLSSSVQDCQETGPLDSLTGPIERLDQDTVKAHLEVMAGHISDIRFYQELSRILLAMTIEKKQLDRDDPLVKAIYSLLERAN